MLWWNFIQNDSLVGAGKMKATITFKLRVPKGDLFTKPLGNEIKVGQCFFNRTF